MKPSVTAVIVTYNRFELLKKTIACLRNQTHALDSIIVINNSSTDGTGEWLDLQSYLTVIHQENVGGAGGFYRGIEEAYKRNFDWIWCMDDDVFPRPDCLEQYLRVAGSEVGILTPARYREGEFLSGEYMKLNLSNPFLPLHIHRINKEDVSSENPFEIEAMSFEGPLIRREVVEKIGLPNKELFIFYDDTDFSYRSILAGYKILSVPKAIFDKHKFNVNKTKVEIRKAGKWRVWYNVRNTAYFAHHYGKNWLFREFGGIGFFLKMFFAMLKNIPFNDKYEIRDIVKLVKMERRGRKEILGRL